MIRAPAKRPCPSCPYRRDVPSGVWAEEEYAKLPEYDLPTGDQPFGTFMCHQQDDRICAGWCGCHDMDESLAMRFAAAHMEPEDLLEVRHYTTDVPLFASGAEAAEHGRERIERPDAKARKTIDHLTAKRRRRAA